MKKYDIDTLFGHPRFFISENDFCDFSISRKGDVYPCSIVPARYGGGYEGGSWLAFPKDSNHLPEHYDASDIECAYFWENYDDYVGKGNTPQEAYDNLMKQLNETVKKESKK